MATMPPNLNGIPAQRGARRERIEAKNVVRPTWWAWLAYIAVTTFVSTGIGVLACWVLYGKMSWYWVAIPIAVGWSLAVGWCVHRYLARWTLRRRP